MKMLFEAVVDTDCSDKTASETADATHYQSFTTHILTQNNSPKTKVCDADLHHSTSDYLRCVHYILLINTNRFSVSEARVSHIIKRGRIARAYRKGKYEAKIKTQREPEYDDG